MTCRFCQQWNPEPATRCCFCGNQIDAAEDGTAGGRPSAAFRGLAHEPGAPKTPQPERKLFPLGDADLERHGNLLDTAKLVIGVIIAIAVGLWLLFRLKYRF